MRLYTKYTLVVGQQQTMVGLKEAILQMRNKYPMWNDQQGKHCQEYLEFVNVVGINLP